MISKFLYKAVLVVLISIVATSCKEDEYSVPEGKSGLQNDCIRKSLGPGIAGMDVEFAYAMAIQPSEGKLVSARVEASIPGADGTYLDNRSFYTNDSGVDVGVPVADASVTSGAVTEISFNDDINAATLRYFYRIPAEAMGKEVSFNFSVTSSNGETVSYKMGPYQIRRMERALNLELVNGEKCYISIEDMAVYTADEAAGIADKIDLVYLHRTVPNITFLHSLVAPAADPIYLPGITLPSSVNRNVKLQKAWNIKDPQLESAQPNGVFVDDIDFERLDLANASNAAIDLKAQAGVWVETADGRYRAYIHINSLSEGAVKGAKISMKRYRM